MTEKNEIIITIIHKRRPSVPLLTALHKTVPHPLLSQSRHYNHYTSSCQWPVNGRPTPKIFPPIGRKSKVCAHCTKCTFRTALFFLFLMTGTLIDYH